ncbi:hypothetical protein ACTUVN_004781 [Pseudomonas caspiana]
MTTDLRACFYDSSRSRDDVYDFGVFKLPELVTRDIRDAFVELTGHYACRSRRQAWRSAREFIRFLETTNVNKIIASKSVITGFADHLNKNTRLKKTNGTHFNFARKIVAWLSDSDLSIDWSGQTSTYFDFSRERFNTRDNEIDAPLLKTIIGCCKLEIIEIRKCLKVRQTIFLENTSDLSGLNIQDTGNLRRVIELERKNIWTQKQMLAAGEFQLIHSSVRRFTKYRELNARTILPIFLLILIESGANPISIMEMSFDCLYPHPTDESMVILVWKKARAGSEQRLQFLKTRYYSVPALVGLVKEMTVTIRPLAKVEEQEILFIARTGMDVRRVSIQNYHNQLKDFRDKHQLPFFTFSDIRKAVASLLFAKFGERAIVGKFLQHRKLSTTDIYLKDKASYQKQFESVHRFQGQMIDLSLTPSASELEEGTTMLGLKCGSPNKDIKKRSRVNGICVEFTQCATCKNAIIIRDDAKHVARIVNAKRSLEQLKIHSHSNADLMDRFKSEYQTTLDIITNEILPLIQTAVLKEAEELASQIYELPRMY